MAKEKKKGFVLRQSVRLVAYRLHMISWTTQREKSPRKPLLQSAFWHLTASVTW